MSQPLEKIDAKKSLGQHFLNNARVPKLMADAASVGEGDVVLEIGPGTGVLTRELLNRGATVIAIEADRRAIESLQRPFQAEIASKKLILYHTDIRTADIASFGVQPYAYKAVANIPYYLSGRLFRFFLESPCQPSTLVFLVQKEVAERIARTKKESLLSLSVKVFGEPHYILTVKRGNFTPPPKVDSAIIAIEHISKKRLGSLSAEQFFTLIHAGFGARRKQLFGNLLKAGLAERAALTTAFAKSEISLHARGEDLPLPAWLRLGQSLFLHSQSTVSPEVNHSL